MDAVHPAPAGGPVDQSDSPDNEEDLLALCKVNIPTSDILTFLKNINLPPEQLAGFGSPQQMSGSLSFSIIDPTPENPQTVADFSVTITGSHTRVAPAMNPNQPGYVSPTTPTIPTQVIDHSEGDVS